MIQQHNDASMILDFVDMPHDSAADYSTRAHGAICRRRERYCMRYCTTTLASAGLVVQPLAAVCTATVSDAPAA